MRVRLVKLVSCTESVEAVLSSSHNTLKAFRVFQDGIYTFKVKRK